MGVSQSRGQSMMTREEGVVANTFPDGLDMNRNKFSCESLSQFSILNPDDPDKEAVQEKMKNKTLTRQEERAIGCMLGLVVGDALGAPLEFTAVRYGSEELQEMGQEDVWTNVRYNKFGLKSGQWTDDASMSLCVADSLLVQKGFDPLDLRLRFLNWWQFGYNNAFGYDDSREASSVGLGGNIGSSFGEFQAKRTEYTTAGDRRTSGNGSLMRLAPIPIYFASVGEAEGLEAAYNHSKTTHQGDEAAECCRLLTRLVMTLINFEGDANEARALLDNLHEGFESTCYSVNCLARGVVEDKHEDNENLDLKDRRWNWRDPDFKYAPGRARQQPGYIGSYAMDNLSMSLHCVYTTSSPREALLKAANMCGDADTVCAVVGQICGALYGVSEIPANWIAEVQRWDRNGDIALRAYKLFHHADL